VLKRRDGRYLAGRRTDDWVKWRSDRLALLAVLTAAAPDAADRSGSMRFVEYSLAVWNSGELVPIARLSGGLPEEDLDFLDRYVRFASNGRFGPLRTVPPRYVMEIEFESLEPAPRRKSGLELCGARLVALRRELKPEEADSLDLLNPPDFA
jgi:DNA ligase-1